MKNPYFLNVFCDVHDLSLFISVMAFLPSLSVLKTSQERQEIIRIESIMSEINVVSMLLVN